MLNECLINILTLMLNMGEIGSTLKNGQCFKIEI